MPKSKGVKRAADRPVKPSANGRKPRRLVRLEKRLAQLRRVEDKRRTQLAEVHARIGQVTERVAALTAPPTSADPVVEPASTDTTEGRAARRRGSQDEAPVESSPAP